MSRRHHVDGSCLNVGITSFLEREEIGFFSVTFRDALDVPSRNDIGLFEPICGTGKVIRGREQEQHKASTSNSRFPSTRHVDLGASFGTRIATTLCNPLRRALHSDLSPQA